MSENIENQITNEVFQFFIESRDFNGISLSSLSNKIGVDKTEVLASLKQLVSRGVVSIQCGENPHIIRLQHVSDDEQLKMLSDAANSVTSQLEHFPNIVFETHLICIYPSQQYLKDNRDVSDFESRPFTSELALGEPHLAERYFEIRILEQYINDPRLIFFFEDYSGKIAYYEENMQLLSEHEQFYLKSFGLGMDANGDRVVVAYLRYLQDLSPEQQLHWRSYQVLNRECWAVPEYTANSNGSWVISISVFSAFIEEQRNVNELSKVIFGTSMFKATFEDSKRPREFTFFFFPTTKNFQSFVLLLDKMISENLNAEFFKGQKIETFAYKPLGEGMVERIGKGTLQMLEEWLSKNYKYEGAQDLVREFLEPFRKVRKLRQKPAHSISNDIYNKQLLTEQKDIIELAYDSMKLLRQILQKHPTVRSYKLSSNIESLRVRSF